MVRTYADDVVSHGQFERHVRQIIESLREVRLQTCSITKKRRHTRLVKEDN